MLCKRHGPQSFDIALSAYREGAHFNSSRLYRQPRQVFGSRWCNAGQWSSRSRLSHSYCRAQGNGARESVQKDEPEVAVLFVACGIGLVTGAGVVLFNYAIETIRQAAFLQAPVESVAWGIWARQLSLKSSLLVTLLPPTVGGLSVGLLRYLSGGFADPPALTPVEARQQGPETARRLLKGIQELGTQAAHRLQGSPDLPESKAAETSKARLSSGGAASESDPGSRDFSLNGSKAEGLSQEGIQSMASTSGQSGSYTRGAKRQIRGAIAPVLRATAAAITLGSGCSLGPEGPSVEIGRSSARGLGRVLRSKQRRLLPLLAAGSGAGVAAGFNAPISGVFFAVESVLQREPRDSETEARNSSGLTVAMVLLASVVAAIVSRAGLGDNPAFKVPPYQLQSLWEIPLVMLLGSACGLVSVGFSYCSEVSSKLFKRLNPEGSENPLVWVLMPALGGLCTGTVALVFPEILYQGFGNVNALLEVKSDVYAPLLLLQMLGAKVVVTAVCRGSGLVGGIYAPSIFMGAALGTAVGGLAQAALTPSGLLVAAPAAYALVGVAAMLAANCQVPLTAVLLLFELTHDYFIIIPTLTAVGISYWTASLPIAAGISQRLQANAGPDVGAGSVTSIDGDDLIPGEPLISQIKVSSFISGKKRRSGNNDSDRPRIAITEDQGPGGNGILAQMEEASSRQSLSLSAGVSAQQPSRNGSQGLEISMANGSQTPKIEAAATTAMVDAMQELTAQCALEECCVLVARDTPLSEALLLLDSADQTTALVLDEQQRVSGVLTRDKILAALEAEAECRVKDTSDDGEGCVVELVVGSRDKGQ